MIRTVTLPIAPGASWADLAWADKDPADVLPYAVDAGPWLADAGLSIAGTPSLAATLGLPVSGLAVVGGLVTFIVGAGLPGVTALIAVTIPLSNGDQVVVIPALPIRAGVPSGLVPVIAGVTGHVLLRDGVSRVLCRDGSFLTSR